MKQIYLYYVSFSLGIITGGLFAMLFTSADQYTKFDLNQSYQDGFKNGSINEQIKLNMQLVADLESSYKYTGQAYAQFYIFHPKYNQTIELVCKPGGQ